MKVFLKIMLKMDMEVFIYKNGDRYEGDFKNGSKSW